MAKKLMVTCLAMTLLAVSGSGSSRSAEGKDFPKNELTKALEKAGWVLLPIPETGYGPGSVIGINDKGNLRWIGEFASCNPTDQELKKALEVIDSAGPSLDTSSEYGAGAGLALAIPGVNLKMGAKIGKEKKSSLKIESSGARRLDLIKLSNWWSEHSNEVSGGCADWLNRENIFVINEAWWINDSTFTLWKRDEKAVEVKYEPMEIEELLSISAEAGARLNSSYEMTIVQPTYLAVRHVAYFKDLGIFGPMDSPEAVTEAVKSKGADAKLRELIDAEAEMKEAIDGRGE